MGQVFQLDGVYAQSAEAFRRARELRIDNRIHLSRTIDGKWAIYWRPRDETVECKPPQYKIGKSV